MTTWVKEHVEYKLNNRLGKLETLKKNLPEHVYEPDALVLCSTFNQHLIDDAYLNGRFEQLEWKLQSSRRGR